MRGRPIHNDRLVLDLLEYSDYIDDDGFILFLDFYKTFDMVEHGTLWFWRELQECSQMLLQ